MDRTSRTSHEASFVPGPAGRLFVAIHRPVGPSPQVGVVVCPPVLAEAARNYRREFQLACALAERGHAVARFHPRGAGHSHEAEGVTFTDLVEDAAAVADHLVATTRVTHLVLIGTRLGAMVAAALRGRRHDCGRLVLWQPVTGGDAYLRELHRVRLMTHLRGQTRTGRAQRLDRALAEDHTVEIAGHALDRALHASIEDLDLARLLDPPRGDLLVLEMNGQMQVRSDVRALVEAWRAAGARASAEAVSLDEPWWFGASARADTYEAPTTGIELVARSVGFLTEREAVAT